MAINKTNLQLLLTSAETVLAKNTSIYAVSKTFGVSSCGVCLPMLIRDYMIVNLFGCIGVKSLTEEEQEDLLNKATNNTRITFVEPTCGDETFLILKNASDYLLINQAGDRFRWL